GHGSTYGGSPLVCAAGTAVLQVLRDEALGERAERLGNDLRRRLDGMNLPAVKAVTGRGLMVGLDLRIRPQLPLKALPEQGFLALAGGTQGLRLLPPL